MTEVVRGGKVAFVPKARLLKLIGGELIRDDVMAMMELVKNSHDADATHVEVRFSGAITRHGEIVVKDDGFGMSVDELLQHWMQPAGSSKRDPSAKRTPKGRRVLGEKGVGRFAVDRLGRHCEIISRKPGSATEIAARFDWDAFDCDKTLLSEIMAEWEERAPETIDTHGTIVIIHGLRQAWSNRSFRRLTSRMQRILSPFHRDHDFSVTILSDDLPDYSGEVQQPYLERAPYQVRAVFDGLETVSYEFNGATSETVWPGPGELRCGPVTVSFSIFDLETDAVRRVGQVQDARAWLREWSGVSLYRDGFRVLPYGEPDDDWLRLDQRRVNNPVQRLSNNQICAMVEIASDANPDLRDQTNRGGLVQNRAYEDLRRLVLYVLEIAEAERQEIRNPREPADGQKKKSIAGDSVDSLLRSLRQHAGLVSRKSGFKLIPVLDELTTAYRREKKDLEQTTKVYTELSATGHNAAFVMPSLLPYLDTMDRELEDLEVEGSIDTARLLNLQRLVMEMRDGIGLLAPISGSISESKRTIDLVKEIREFARMAEGIAVHEKTRIESSVTDDLILIEGRRDYLWQVLTIIFRNSLQALSRTDDKKIRIGIQVTPASRKAQVFFRDKGHGIGKNIEDMIFTPGFSTRPGAKGMGLAMARSLISEMDGAIEVSRRYEHRGWTTMQLSFPVSKLS